MEKDAWNPDQYHRFQKERSQPFHDLLALVKPIPGGRAVDLGCGSGELTVHLHRHLQLGETLGIDTSHAMLAKTPTPEAGLHFENSNLEKFSPRQEYDLVFSNAALQWCDDHPRLLRQFAGALKPEGQIAIQMPMNFDYATHRLAAAMRFEAPYAPYFPKVEPIDRVLLPIEEYARILNKLGFNTQRVYVEVYAHILPARADVIEWVKGTLLTRFQSALPAELYALFLDEYRNRLLMMLPDEAPFFYPFKRLLIWGRKAK